MKAEQTNTSTWFFLLFLVAIIIGGLLFIRNQTQFDETVREASSDSNHELENIKLELSKKREELLKVKDELSTKSKQLSKQIADKDREIGIEKEKVQELTRQIADKDKKIRIETAKVQVLKRTIIEKNEKIRTETAKVQDLNRTIIEKDEKIRTEKAKVQDLTNQIAAKDEKIKTETRNVQELERKIADKDRKIETEKGKVQELTNQIAAKDEKIKTETRNVQELERKIAKKEREIETEKGEVQELNRKIADKDREIKTEKGKVQELTNQIAAKDEKIRTEKEKVQNLNEKIIEKNRELSMMQKTSLDRQSGSMIQKLDTSLKGQNLSNIKRRLKQFYIDEYNLSNDDIEIVDNYNYDSTDDEVHWRLRDSNLHDRCIKFSEFGIKLLRNVNNIPKDSNKYLRVIKDIVKRVRNMINENIETLRENENVIEASATLLSMHILIYPGEAQWMNTHETITTSIPEIPSIKSHNYSIEYGHFDENKYKKLLKLSTPRLLTNYINNPKAYLHDVNSGALSAFNSTINNDYCDPGMMLDGIRQDGSAFTFHPTRNVLHIDYSYYLKDAVAHIKYPDFYASVYSELKIPGNYYDVVKKIVSILMHPNLDVVLHGLISSEGKIKLNFNWLDIKGETGCYIIPSIGFGIFKTENLMFPLRIQMPGIPTSCLKTCGEGQETKCNPFATSIMNIRKIHILEHSRHLNDYENWDDVKFEAGIIKKQENEMYMLYSEESYTYSDCNNEYSPKNYIGQLTLDKQVMFWKRICHIHTAEEIEYKITEVGVFTSHGMEAIYQIENLGWHNLLFRSMGTSKGMKTERDVTDGCFGQGQDIVIPPLDPRRSNPPAYFKWYQYVESIGKLSVNLEYKEEKQTFTYNNHKYIVENMPDDPQSFTVKCDTDDNVILIGDNSIRVNDSVIYKNVTYYRDKRTMMYVKP
ncbi:uncharacterized protein LOC130673560 [Microplitis mediator]|uniref:uncharacterized protein LOC130673560 n=1 Tax=Microplitis mediator TaxID=375433 RepID=UPI00255253F2|nr:uncharacterized protein LOC130673560 [Microplitis mediator]